MATIPTFKSYPDPFITIPLNDIPPIPALTYSLGPPPARLLNATLPPQFKYLDAGQLARMHEKFPRKVNEKGYVVFRWMAEDHHGPPVIFVTTALEIAIFDARKEALKNTGMDLDASMITRIAPGMAWTKKFDEMRSLPYLLQVTTLNDAGIHGLTIGSCPGDFQRQKGEKIGDPHLVVPSADFPRLDLRLDAFEEAHTMLAAAYPFADHRFYFFGIGLSQRSVTDGRAIFQSARLGFGCNEIKNDIEKHLAGVPKPAFKNPTQPPVHIGTQDHRHEYEDMNFKKRDFSTQLKYVPSLQRPTKMRAKPGVSLGFLPDTNFASRSLGPLSRLLARTVGEVYGVSVPEVIREVGNVVGEDEEEATPKLKRKIQNHINFLEGKKGRVRVFQPFGPMPRVTHLAAGQSPAVGILDKDLLIRSQVLTLLQTMVEENPGGENVLAVASFDRNIWVLLATITPPPGSKLRIIRLNNDNDGDLMEQALYNATAEWLEPVQATIWWIAKFELLLFVSEVKDSVAQFYYWITEDYLGPIWKRFGRFLLGLLVGWLLRLVLLAFQPDN